jgi:hypothetical protein
VKSVRLPQRWRWRYCSCLRYCVGSLVDTVSIFSPEDGDGMFLRNAGFYKYSTTASQPVNAPTSFHPQSKILSALYCQTLTSPWLSLFSFGHKQDLAFILTRVFALHWGTGVYSEDCRKLSWLLIVWQPSPPVLRLLPRPSVSITERALRWFIYASGVTVEGEESTSPPPPQVILCKFQLQSFMSR